MASLAASESPIRHWLGRRRPPLPGSTLGPGGAPEARGPNPPSGQLPARRAGSDGTRSSRSATRSSAVTDPLNRAPAGSGIPVVPELARPREPRSSSRLRVPGPGSPGLVPDRACPRTRLGPPLTGSRPRPGGRGPARRPQSCLHTVCPKSRQIAPPRRACGTGLRLLDYRD